LAFHVERFLREVLVARIAPVSEQWFKIAFASCRKAAY
jgi:hypothetical protein